MVTNSNSKQISDKYTHRRHSLMHMLMKQHNISAVLITHGVDIRYLTGATEGVSALFIYKDTATVFTSKMFENQIPKQAPGCNMVAKGKAFEDSAVQLRRLRYRRGLGYQGNKLVQSRYRQLADAMGTRQLVDIGESVTRCRTIKDRQELREIKRCVKIAEQAFSELIGKGVDYLLTRTERQLASELEHRMCMLGADQQAFPDNGIIVASGPNSASCHHFPGNRKPRRREPLLFDWGAEKNGYRCDITRVVFMGQPRKLIRDLFEIVSRANAAGIAAIHDRVACADVSDAGWNVVRDAGYENQIRHGLGHGIGLEIHEPPGIGSGGSQQPTADAPVLKAGMVVTIEPGIYIEGKGGVRLEDDVLVTKNGHKVLTTLPTDLESAILTNR